MLGGVRIALLPSYDGTAQLWFDALRTANIAIGGSRRAIVSSFFRAEKNSGGYQLTDDYWALWGESSGQSLLSLKQLRTATAVGSPTFNADRDVTLNGTSSYVNTGFVPSTAGINLTGTNQRMAVYERTNVNANTSSMAAFTSSTVNMKMVTRTGTTLQGTLNSGTASFSITDGRGYSAISRSGGGTTMSAYKNGAQLTNVTGLTVGSTALAIALYIGARNNAGTADNFRATSIGFACAGGPLSAAQELAQYSAVQAWAAAVGANV